MGKAMHVGWVCELHVCWSSYGPLGVNFEGWSVGAGLGGAGVTRARRYGYGRCKWANSFAGMVESMQGRLVGAAVTGRAELVA